MELSGLVLETDYVLVQGNINVQIEDVTPDCDKVTLKSLYVYMRPNHWESVETAISNGATAVVMDISTNIIRIIPENITVIKVFSVRTAYAQMAKQFYDSPCLSLYTVGITGTKGKTTVAYILRDILNSWSIKTGIIGTIGIYDGDITTKTVNTTPDAWIIQKQCRHMVDNGCKVVIMEVSSQGLKQCRTHGIEFDIGIFTNISPDHISTKEHKDFEEYLACKSMLFSQCQLTIANGDDIEYRRVTKSSKKIYTYGKNPNNDYCFDNIKSIIWNNHMSVEFQIHGAVNETIRLPMPGEYSVYNAVCAIAAAHTINPLGKIYNEMLETLSIKGRMEVLFYGDYIVVSDYAHNGIALFNALTSLKEYCRGRLICLFGCGGNRDAKRRTDMGIVSGKISDLTIITSDNPRYEELDNIINDIENGVREADGAFIKISDRKEAIRCACCIAKKGDIVLLAGKGHEDYQEIKGKRTKLDEKEIIKEITEGKN